MKTHNNPNPRHRLTLLGALLLGLASIATPSAAAAEKLLVFAGAASKPPTDEAAKLYEEKTGVKVGSVTLTAVSPATGSSEVLVCIRGEDVMLQREAGVSRGRNRLSARVVAVHPGSPLTRVELDAGFPLLAYLTRPACEELELRAGATVTALIKAPAVHLIARGN